MMPPLISLNEQEVAKVNTVAIGTVQTDSIFQYIVGADGAPESTDEIKKLYEDAGIATYLEVYKAAYERMIAE
jgi:phosphotransferase system IIB component